MGFCSSESPQQRLAGPSGEAKSTLTGGTKEKRTNRVSRRVCSYLMIKHDSNNKHTLAECNNRCNGADRREQGFTWVEPFLINQIWVQFRLFFYCSADQSHSGLWSVVADGDVGTFSSTFELEPAGFGACGGCHALLRNFCRDTLVLIFWSSSCLQH